MFTQVGVRIPFSAFQMALLGRVFVAPSQLHPNSWASIRCFEMVCEYLELPVSVDVFLFFFNLTNPSKERKHKKGFMSFRSAQGRRIFGLFEDSYHGFKDKYFKVRPVKGCHPFWLSLEGARLIPTYWSFGAGSNAFVKVSYKGMSAVDRKIADVLLAIFGRNHVNPHFLMGDREAGRNYICEKSLLALPLVSCFSQYFIATKEFSFLVTVGMSAEITGLPNLFQTFLCASDDEAANEKPTAPSEDKSKATSEQGAVADETGTSAQGALAQSDKEVRVSPFREVVGTGGSTSNPAADDEVEEVPSLKRKRMSSSPEGVLTVMEKNFDTGNFIDSQLIPGTEEHFHESSLAGQARWMYRTLLRGAVIARKAEFELSGMESLRRRLESAGKGNNKLKRKVETLREHLTQSNKRLDATEKKASAAEKKASTTEKKLEESDATVFRLVEREMTLESQVGVAQGRVSALEKEKEAVENELAALKTKYKDVVKQGKGAILATEEALKAQVKIVAPDFDTSAIGVFKVIKDGKIVDVPKK